MTSKHKSEDYLKIGVLNVQRCKSKKQTVKTKIIKKEI